jgi:hypothetical protein
MAILLVEMKKVKKKWRKGEKNGRKVMKKKKEKP